MGKSAIYLSGKNVDIIKRRSNTYLNIGGGSFQRRNGMKFRRKKTTTDVFLKFILKNILESEGSCLVGENQDSKNDEYSAYSESFWRL